MDQTHAALAPLFDAVLEACKKIRLPHGDRVAVRAVDTDYVVPGRTYVLDTASGLFQFWLGVNGPRLMFYALADGVPHYTAEHAFRFLSASAITTSWDVLCEPLPEGLTGLVATSSPDHGIRLVEPADRSTAEEHSLRSTLTELGSYWARETALLAQGWLRSCLRNSIRCAEQEPMPF